MKADVPKWWGARNPLVKREWNTLVWTRATAFVPSCEHPGANSSGARTNSVMSGWCKPSRGLTDAHAETPPKLTVAFLSLPRCRTAYERLF